jgi:putative redox protein
MTDVKVTWQGRLTFIGAGSSGFEVPLGAGPQVGGDNDGFRPMEMIAIGLAVCTAMDVISILQKKRQDVTNFEVKVHAERAEQHPKVFTSAEIEYYLTGRDLDEKALLRAIELSATRYCPAHAMLSKAFPIALKYFLFEEDEHGERQLLNSGEYRTPEVMV